MARAPKTSLPGKLAFLGTEDPVVCALQSFMSGLNHFNEKQMTIRHLKLVMAVKLGCELLKCKTLTRKQVLLFSSLAVDDFEIEFRHLIDHHYIVEHQPTFGEQLCYGVGRAGGTALYPIMKAINRPAAKKETTSGVNRTKDSKTP